MKKVVLLMFIFMSTITLGASEKVAQCAVRDVQNHGVRVNLLKMEDGQFNGNLIFGTTVSGTTYRLKEVSPGLFEGHILKQPTFTLKLSISSHPKVNAYVNGFASTLEAIYPDVTSGTGIGQVKTNAKDDFVCGKIISRF